MTLIGFGGQFALLAEPAAGAALLSFGGNFALLAEEGGSEDGTALLSFGGSFRLLPENPPTPTLIRFGGTFVLATGDVAVEATTSITIRKHPTTGLLTVMPLYVKVGSVLIDPVTGEAV